MKHFRRLYGWLALCAVIAYIPHATADCNCSCNSTSKTFFTVRPEFGVATPEVLSTWRRQQTLCDDECHRGTFQIVPFGGQSTHPARLGKYFMPFCSNEVEVVSAIANTNDHLFAQHFNIHAIQFSPFITNLLGEGFTPLTNPFNSMIQVSPRRSVFGLGLTYQHNFWFHCMQHWFRIIAPLTYVQTNMHLREDVLATGVFNVAPIPGTNLASSPQNMEEALVQSDWEFGKIDHKNHKKFGLAFIQLQLGHVAIDNDCYYFSPYIGVNIPTGNRVKSDIVFEPIVGTGKHWGIFWGLTTEMFLWNSRCDKFELGAAIDINMEYLFKKTQRRSLDLKYKPWSRYIETYANLAQSNQADMLFTGGQILQSIFLASPGINLLTQKVNVKPGYNFTANIALTLLQKCDRGFDGELGYNFYAKQAECISLKNRFSTEAAIKDHLGRGIVNPVRNMTQNRLVNEAQIANLMMNSMYDTAGIQNAYPLGIIQESDLDLASASHPCTLSNILYGTAGYHWDDCCYPMMASVGLSYEFSVKSNATLNRWLLWYRWGISF